MFRSSTVQLSVAFSRRHSADVRRLCTVKKIKNEAEERERARERERRRKKKLTFCGFLGMCQSPRIPHIRFQLRPNPSLSKNVLPPEKRLSFDNQRLKLL